MKRLPKSLLFLLPLAALVGIGFFAFRQYAAPDPLASIAHANGRLEFARMDVASLYAGRVEYRLAEPGNVLPAGGKVVSLLNLNDASISLFLPAPTVNQIPLGSEARIKMDGLDAVFPAKVTYIASEAQFTPKFVETAEERTKLMFRVKLQIPADVAAKYQGYLKGGMTATGFVRTDPKLAWPADLQTRLPQ